MAKRKMPARYTSGPKRGQFKPKAKRKSPARKRATPRRNAPQAAAPRRAAPRRNAPRRPKMPDLVGMLMDGTVNAGQVLVGKAAARSVPDLMGLPKEGNVGLAIQAAVAVGVGFFADMFLSRQAAAAILAGGLTAPLETFLVAQDVPWIGEALSPVTAAAEVGAYTMGRYPARVNNNRLPGNMGRYPAARPSLMAGYPDPETPDDYSAAHGYF